MTILEIMERIKDQKVVVTSDYPHERVVRDAIRKLKKQGIVFIAVHKGKGTYERIEIADKKKVEKYMRSETKRWKSHYFDNLLPLKGKTQNLIFEQMMGQLEGVIANDH